MSTEYFKSWKRAKYAKSCSYRLKCADYHRAYQQRNREYLNEKRKENYRKHHPKKEQPVMFIVRMNDNHFEHLPSGRITHF